LVQVHRLVSVVLLVYNGEKYLIEQLKSITLQTYTNLEIIVVDDNSRDRSLDIVKEAAAIDTRIKVYQNPVNLGIVPNFLKAISYTSGEFVCFSDQDDYWRKDKVEILVRFLEKDDKNMLVYSDLEICDSTLISIKSSFWEYSRMKPKSGYLRELAFLRNIAPCCSMMCRRRVVDSIAGFSEEVPFYADHLVFIISVGLGKITYSDEKLMKYRQHDSNSVGAFYDSLVSEDTIAKDLRHKIKYFRKNPFRGVTFNLDRMDRFANSLYSKNLFERLPFLDYYLFLRNDTLVDKLLGILQCLFPVFYIWLKSKMKGICKKKCFSWMKRIIFIMWTFIVLTIFFMQFILHKLYMRFGV
jgi:glycosyltransferase involved in cell wall biosynthesis